MTEEIKTQNEQKNTVATVGMVFSIIWLIALITVFFARLWLPLLIVWFILWIIGLFYKPRGKARVAICIPLVVFIAIASVVCYIWNSVKTPANEFGERAKETLNNETLENVDEEAFKAIMQNEINELISNKTEDEWKNMFENSTWSNAIEKASYLFFGLVQESLENSLEKYNNWELPEIIDSDNEIITVDIDVEDNEDEDTNEESENSENTTKENVEVFTQSEKNDIQQILNILE